MLFRIPKGLIPPQDKIIVLDTKYADVTGDGLLDTLTLTGTRPFEGSVFTTNITLTVENKKTGIKIKVMPNSNSGYDPVLFIGRFKNDKTPQVLLSIASGGSGGFYFNYIYSFKNNISKLIFDYEEFNEESVYTVTYMDYYRVKVLSKDKSLKGIIDLTGIRDKEYISALYNTNGTLKKPTSGYVLGLNSLCPLSLNGYEPFKLLSIQRIIGLYNADTLGSIESILVWDKNEFSPDVTRLVVPM